MRNSEIVPKLEQAEEVGRKGFGVGMIVREFTTMLDRERIVNIDVEEGNGQFDDHNPDDKGHESMKDAL